MVDRTERILNHFPGLRVLVLGEGMLDRYYGGVCSRLCREAPVPIISINKIQNVPGGAANSAVNLRLLGAEVSFVTVVGDDAEGDQIISGLNAYGINTHLIQRENNRLTLVKNRITADNQILMRFDSGTVNPISDYSEHNIISIFRKYYEQFDIILISDYGYGICTDKIRKTISMVQKKYRKILAIDAKYIDRYCHMPATLLKPNYEEMLHFLKIQPGSITGARKDFFRKIRKNIFRKIKSRMIALTLDSDGAIIIQDDGMVYETGTVPADPAKTIGAGDTYTAAIALALGAAAGTATAANIASAAARLGIDKGNTTSCNLRELINYFSNNRKLITSRSDLKMFLDSLRLEHKTIVFTNGCFDILHSGHISYLEQAKQLGDVLIVGVNSDESVARLKGPGRPVNVLADRLKVLSGLSSIDALISFSEKTPVELIKNISPDYYVKGGDYSKENLPEAPIVEKLGGKVIIVPFIEEKSTTGIITKINNSKNDFSYTNN